MCNDNSISYYINIRSVDGESVGPTSSDTATLTQARDTALTARDAANTAYDAENAPIVSKEAEITAKGAEIVTLQGEENELRTTYEDASELLKTIAGTEESIVTTAKAALDAKIAEKETAEAALVILQTELATIKTGAKVAAVAAALVTKNEKQTLYDKASDALNRLSNTNTHVRYNDINLDHLKSKHPSGAYGQWLCRIVNFNLHEPQGINSPSIDIECDTLSSDQYITTNKNNILILATIPASETHICGDASTDIYSKDGRSTLFCIDNPTPWILVNIGQRIMEIKLKSSISDRNIHEKSSLKTVRPTDAAGDIDPSYFALSDWHMKLEFKPFIE